MLNVVRSLFGADTVKMKLQKAKFNMDAWFTGGDFANESLRQIQAAVRRRYLAIVSVCHS